MSMEKWPFYPEKLSEIFDLEMITFLEIAAGKLLGKATVILELKDEQYERFSPNRELEINDRERFCRRLRNTPEVSNPIIGGTKACRWFDGQVAKSILTKAKKNKNIKLKAEKYLCHMKLQDAYSIIYIGDYFPVAVLLTGQRLPDSSEAQKLIEKEIDALNGQPRILNLPWENNVDMKFVDELAISASTEAKNDLMKFAKKIRRWETDTLDILKTQTEKIEKLATITYEIKKNRKIEEFFTNLDLPSGYVHKNRNSLQLWIREKLILAMEFCDVEWIGLFGHWDQNKNILELIAEANTNLDTNIDNEQLYLFHFNWRKAGLPDNEEILSNQYNNLTDLIYHKGLKHHDGIMTSKFEQIKSAELRLPYLHSGNEKILLCIKGIKKSVELSREIEFFIKMKQRIGALFIHCADFINNIDLQRRSQAVADHIAHQVKSTLTPVRGDAEITSLYLNRMKTNVDIEKVKGKLKELDNHIETLSQLSNITLSQLHAELDCAFHFREDQFSETDIIELVNEIADEFRAEAKIKKLLIEVIPNTTSPIYIPIVRPALYICITNLFDNALKYCFPDTIIKIIFSYNDPIPYSSSEITIEFSTIGQKIEQREVEIIFDRGIRGKNAGAEAGSGFGLWESREILRAHSGNISLIVSSHSKRSKNDFVIKLSNPKSKIR